MRGRGHNAGPVDFSIATAADAADIATLLRSIAMGGWVRIAMARDPDPFAADLGLGDPHAFVLARDPANGLLIGACEVSVRGVWADGAARRLAYIGALRIAPSHRHRIAILRGGFALVGSVLEKAGLQRIAFTAIADDNTVARRLLTAGLPDLPSYLAVGGLVTLALPTSGRHRMATFVTPSPPEPEVITFLADNLSRHPLAPVWNQDYWSTAAATGVPLPQFVVARDGDDIAGTIAVWDQRRVRQTLVTGYTPSLARTRHLVNAAAGLLRMPRLPRAGSPLDQAYLSHFAVRDGDSTMALSLIESGLSLARSRDIAVAVIGLPAASPLLPLVRKRFGGLVYRSTIYIVHWPETAEGARRLGETGVYPDVAVL